MTSYALAVNNHFLSEITLYKSPRKLKVSFSSSNMDLGHCNIADLGSFATIKDNKKYFKVYMGGGLGRNPKIHFKFCTSVSNLSNYSVADNIVFVPIVFTFIPACIIS